MVVTVACDARAKRLPFCQRILSQIPPYSIAVGAHSIEGYIEILRGWLVGLQATFTEIMYPIESVRAGKL